MDIPIFLGIVLTFTIWLHYEIHKTKKSGQKSSDAFWKRENKSNLTRRVDITNLDYIKIPFDQLPMADQCDETIDFLRDTIKSLSTKKILNLTGLSNTELKLKYGVSNITKLSEFDNNYILLIRTLQKWAQALYANGLLKEAVSVLEFALSCHTDIRKSYQLLAQIYVDLNTPEKIEQLFTVLDTNQNIIEKQKLITDIKTMCSSQ